MTVILLSTTPIAGLGALLGLGRFEEWALHERPAERLGTDPMAASSVDLSAEAVQPEIGPMPARPLHQAA